MLVVISLAETHIDLDDVTVVNGWMEQEHGSVGWVFWLQFRSNAALLGDSLRNVPKEERCRVKECEINYV